MAMEAASTPSRSPFSAKLHLLSHRTGEAARWIRHRSINNTPLSFKSPPKTIVPLLVRSWGTPSILTLAQSRKICTCKGCLTTILPPPFFLKRSSVRTSLPHSFLSITIMAEWNSHLFRFSFWTVCPSSLPRDSNMIIRSASPSSLPQVMVTVPLQPLAPIRLILHPKRRYYLPLQPGPITTRSNTSSCIDNPLKPPGHGSLLRLAKQRLAYTAGIIVIHPCAGRSKLSMVCTRAVLTPDFNVPLLPLLRGRFLCLPARLTDSTAIAV